MTIAQRFLLIAPPVRSLLRSLRELDAKKPGHYFRPSEIVPVRVFWYEVACGMMLIECDSGWSYNLGVRLTNDGKAAARRL